MLVAENGATGYDKAVTEKPDVILMDLDLPVMDGWEASRQLKSNDGISAAIAGIGSHRGAEFYD